MIYTFEYKIWEETGSKGWLMKGSPDSYDPLGPMAVAHDILEHFPKDDGSCQAEMQAMGAMLFIRGRGNYWIKRYPQSRPSPGYHLAGELMNLMQRSEFLSIEQPPITHKLEGIHEDAEFWIMEAIREARRDSCGTDERYILDNFVPGWIRTGYRRAKTRYKKSKPDALEDLFHQIEEAMYKRARDVMHDATGQKLQVSVCFKRGNVHTEWL